MRVDVVIMTALAEERAAVCDALEESPRFRSREEYEGERGRAYEIFTLETKVSGLMEPADVRVAVCEMSDAGPINAAVAAAQMLTDLSPTVTILVGIAGCMGSDKKFSLGDVAVGEDIFDCVLRKERLGKVDPEWKSHRCDDTLTKKIKQWAGTSNWAKRMKTRRPDGSKGPPTAYMGAYVSGNYVLADEKKKAELREQCPNRRLLAIEMEAGGIKAVLEHQKEYDSFLIIKAFSDWAGEDKEEGSSNKDLWHSYACRSAAVFTSEVITELLGGRLARYRQLPDSQAQFAAKAFAALNCYVESATSLPESFKETARELFSSAIEETRQLTDALSWTASRENDVSEFRARIGQGQQFLTRARPLFEGAEQIIAFSVDTVSTFWQSEEMKPLVKKYIDSQGCGSRSRDNVIRTFVFSSPEEAHLYARRLDYHAGRFANTFVCSAEHYRSILRDQIAVDEASATAWMNRDFAVLDYEDEKGLSRQYFAHLELDNLAIRRISDDVVQGIQVSQVRKLGGDLVLHCTVPGKTHLVHNVPILKWHPRLWDDKKAWSGILSEMFDQRTSDVYHVTGFTVSSGPHYGEFRRALARMKNDLWTGGQGRKSLTKKYRIKGIGLTKRSEYGEGRPRDRTTNGRLHYIADRLPEDVVIMRVSDRADLDGFLADEEHARLRFKLYEELAKSNAVLDAALKQHRIGSWDDLKSLGRHGEGVFEAIENAAGLWRVDLQDDEMLDEVVEWQPRPF